jgi:hypothetical protein
MKRLPSRDYGVALRSDIIRRVVTLRGRNLFAWAVLCVAFLVPACGPNTVHTIPVPSPTPTLNPIVATPSSLLFSAFGAPSAQTVTLSELGYQGAFSLRTACTIVSASVITEASYAITPLANGTCTLTFFDANGQSINVPVTVSSVAPPSPSPSAAPSTSPSPGFGPIVASPISFAFLGTGNALAQTLTLTETNYAGTFSLKAACAQTVVTQSTSSTFSIAPLANGSCGLSFGDANGQTILVPVIVTVTNGGGQ